jgi:hypothetical protein
VVFGVFESAVGSEVEVGLAKQASIDNFNAAVYDVREKLGPILFASRDVEEFRHKVAMMKADQSVYKIIESHTFPLPKVIRRIVGKNSVLEQEFLHRLGGPNDSGSVPNPPVPAPAPGGALPPVSPNANQDFGPTMGGSPQDPNSANWGAIPLPPVTSSRTACWPGCHENEAHAAKFHSKDKEGRYRHAAPPGDLGGGPTPNLPGGPYPAVPSQAPPYNPPGLNDFGPSFDPQNFNKTPENNIPGTVASRRRADFESVQDIDDTFEDHQGQVLKPKGDFKGYLNKMDQGAPQKVKRNFASKEAVNVYLAWCQAHNLSAARLSSLDRYAANLSTADYFRLANVVLAWDDEHHPKVPSTTLKAKDKVAKGKSVTPLGTQPTKPDTNVYRSKGGDPWEQVPDEENWNPQHNNPNWHKGQIDPMRPYLAWCQKHGLRYISARNINHYAARDPQLAYFLAMRCKEAIRTARKRQGGGNPKGSWTDERIRWENAHPALMEAI